MTEVPAATPVTVPVEPIVATAGLALLHVPPDVMSVSVRVDPAQKAPVFPPIADTVQG